MNIDDVTVWLLYRAVYSRRVVHVGPTGVLSGNVVADFCRCVDISTGNDDYHSLLEFIKGKR